MKINLNSKTLTMFLITLIIILSFCLVYQNGVYNKSIRLSERIKDYDILKSKFTKLTVDNRLLNLWGVRGGTIVSDYFPNRYYYAMSDGGGNRIGYYDLETDLDFDLLKGNINIAENTNWMYIKDYLVSNKDLKFEIVGFDVNKLVFYETRYYDTPGVCANLWVRAGDIVYKYLDISDENSLPEIYNIPSVLKQKYQDEEKQCIKDNS